MKIIGFEIKMNLNRKKWRPPIILLVSSVLLGLVLEAGSQELPAQDTPSRAALFPNLNPYALPQPTGCVERVSTEIALQQAFTNLKSNCAIIIEPGIYKLTRTLELDNNLRNITIQGATTKAADVVLAGAGMTNPDYGKTPGGIRIGTDQNVLIANLTIKDAYRNGIFLDAKAGAPLLHLYNVHVVNAGEACLKVGGGIGAKDLLFGIVEQSIFEYTSTTRSSETVGVALHRSQGWVIRNNVFRNIRAPEGVAAGPALFAKGGKNTVVSANTFLDCQKNVVYEGEVSGVIRNNFVYRSKGPSDGPGILVSNSSDVKVLHNTVVLNGTAQNAIACLGPNRVRLEVRFNLTDGPITKDGQTKAAIKGNITEAKPSWFLLASIGDLHLASTAEKAIDRARQRNDVKGDYDGQSRDDNGDPDIGADEFSKTEGLNRPPFVETGEDQTAVANTAFMLNGSAMDDGRPVPGKLTFSWSKRSGPGAAAFENNSLAITTATLTEPGTYFLRLYANDGLIASYDEVAIVVLPVSTIHQLSVVKFAFLPNKGQETRILADLAKPERLELVIESIDGKTVKKLLEEARPQGRVEMSWDGRDAKGEIVPPGPYKVLMRTGQETLVRRVVVLR